MIFLVHSRVTWITRLKALSDESRLRIVGALVKKRLSVNELAEKLGLSQYNVSKHLRILRQAGILEMEPNDNRREYFIAPKFQRQLARNKNELDLGCCVFRFDQLPRS